MQVTVNLISVIIIQKFNVNVHIIFTLLAKKKNCFQKYQIFLPSKKYHLSLWTTTKDN